MSLQEDSGGGGCLEYYMRSLTHQRTHTAKRRKIGENLYTQEDDDTEVEAHTAWNYLRKLDIYFMALSIARVKREGSVGNIATCLRDGTATCPDFQTGCCKAKDCTKGVHRCGVVQKSRRVYGSFGQLLPLLIQGLPLVPPFAGRYPHRFGD